MHTNFQLFSAVLVENGQIHFGDNYEASDYRRGDLKQAACEGCDAPLAYGGFSGEIPTKRPGGLFANIFRDGRNLSWRMFGEMFDRRKKKIAIYFGTNVARSGCLFITHMWTVTIAINPHTIHPVILYFLEIYGVSLDVFIWNSFKATFIITKFNIVFLQIIIKTLIHMCLDCPTINICLRYLTQD